MLRLIFLFAFSILICCLAAAQTPPATSPDISKANSLLERAKFYVELKEYDKAQKDIAEAMSVAASNNEVTNRAKLLSQTILEETARKQKQEEARARTQHLSQLAEAERQSAQG